MMSLFRDLSVRWKVISIVMLVTAVVLAIADLLVAVTDVLDVRRALAERVGALARVASINTAAALAFQDPEAAHEILAGFGSEEDVIRIQVRTLDGALFAQYLSAHPQHADRLAELQAQDPWRGAGPAAPAGTALSFQRSHLDLDMAVMVNGKPLGYMRLQYDTADLGRRIRYQILLAVLVFLGGMGIAFLLAARLHGLISRPLGDVARAMEETAARQDFSIRLDAHQRDELGTLMRAFNTMLEQIELRDAELRDARDAAEAGSQAKSQFLVSMSHEIRTPMNGILGMAELLAGTRLDTRQRHFIQTIQVSADSLLAIINDILDFSKIEAGRLDLERLDFDLCEIVERTMDLLSESARAKGLQLRASIPAGFPGLVRGDPGRLQQILTNLLSNAIKFTEQGGVRLSLACLEERQGWVRVRITVADTGIGIPPEQHERVFERFSQADSSTSRRHGGTGLGLAISKQLVELMRGRIALEQASPQGSVFWVELPLERQPSPGVAPGLSCGGLNILLVTRERQTQQTLERECAELEACLTWRADLHDAIELALTQVARGGGFDVYLIERSQLPAIELPAGRVLRDLIGQAAGAAILGEEATAEGLDYAWGHLRTLSTPVVSADLARYLGAIIQSCGGHGGHAGARELFIAGGALANLGLHVLVAEDNEVNQEVVDSMLKALGCRITLCADGELALTAFTRAPPDLILMDCQMPVLDGYESTRRIRALERERGGHVPIVALTAHAMRGDRERALAAGMDDFLSKPFKLSQLTAVLRRWGRDPAAGESGETTGSADGDAGEA